MNQDAQPSRRKKAVIVRMPDELHERLRQAVGRERINANELCLLAIERVVERSEAKLRVHDLV